MIAVSIAVALSALLCLSAVLSTILRRRAAFNEPDLVPRMRRLWALPSEAPRKQAGSC